MLARRDRARRGSTTSRASCSTRSTPVSAAGRRSRSGRRLAELARSAQVLVVTHLPQVAAFADRHVVVAKAATGHVTSSEIDLVDGEARLRELSRMLGGLEESALAQDHAEELLAAAAAAKAPTSADDPFRAMSQAQPAGSTAALADSGVMRLAVDAPARAGDELPGATGPVRLDRRTKNLTRRLRPGDIAVIDHVDLDRVAAEALVACQVAGGRQRRAEHLRSLPEPRARASCSPPASRCSTTSGAEVFGRLREGDRVRLDDDTRLRRRRRGPRQGRRSRRPRPSQRRWPRRARGCPRSSRRSPPTRWSTCAASATCCSTASASPTSRTELEGRHVLVVVRGYTLPRGPRRAAALHPRVQAGADRRRRRRRRAARARA